MNRHREAHTNTTVIAQNTNRNVIASEARARQPACRQAGLIILSVTHHKTASCLAVTHPINIKNTKVIACPEHY